MLHPTVSVDVDATFDLSVTAYLRIGGVSLGRIGTFAVRATATPTAVVLPVAPVLAERARAQAATTHRTRGSVAFVVHAANLPRITFESWVSLRPPVRSSLVRVAVGDRVQGARQTAAGTVALRVPGWLRTSQPGVNLATFTAIPAGEGCRADVFAQASVEASRSARALLAELGPGDPSRPQSRTSHVVGSDPAAAQPQLDAVGVQRVGLHRYARLRLHVGFRPGCPPAAARAPSLVRALQAAVGRVDAAVRLR